MKTVTENAGEDGRCKACAQTLFGPVAFCPYCGENLVPVGAASPKGPVDSKKQPAELPEQPPSEAGKRSAASASETGASSGRTARLVVQPREIKFNGLTPGAVEEEEILVRNDSLESLTCELEGKTQSGKGWLKLKPGQSRFQLPPKGQRTVTIEANTQDFQSGFADTANLSIKIQGKEADRIPITLSLAEPKKDPPRPRCSKCGGDLDPITGICSKCKPNPVSKVPLIAFAVVILAVGGYAGYRVFEGRGGGNSSPEAGKTPPQGASNTPTPPGSGQVTPPPTPGGKVKPPPPPRIVTEATIITNPQGASLIVDEGSEGSVTGISPMMAIQLEPGRHTVKITLEGYQDEIKSFILAKGKSKEFDYFLARVPTPTQTSTPPTTTTTTTPPSPPPTSPQVPVPTPPPAKSSDMVLAEQEVDEAVAWIDVGRYSDAITQLKSVIRRIPDYQRAKDQLDRAVREEKKVEEEFRKQQESEKPRVTKGPISPKRR